VVHDALGGPPVAVGGDRPRHRRVAPRIVQELAKGGEEALGHRIRLAGRDDEWTTVVGIVGDVRQYGLDQRASEEIYFPVAQAGFVSRIVMRTAAEPLAMYQYNYHAWTEPPGVLLRDVSVDYLRSSGVAERVVTPDVRVRSSHVLVGRIRRLEHQRGASPAVALSLELGLVRERDQSLVLLETYSVTAPSSGPGVPEAVDALNDALAEIFRRFIADLSAE